MVVAAAAVVLPDAALASGRSVSSTGPAHLGAPRGKKTTSSGNLIDHGGAVLATPTAVPIFWGSFDATTVSDAPAGIHAFLSDLVKSSYLNIASQYMRGAGLPNMTVARALIDTSPPPSHSPSVATIAAEVLHEVQTLDPGAVYLVYTSNFPKGGSFCAWHSAATTTSGITFQVAYLPNVANVAGCAASTATNIYSPGTQALADDTAHEFMEAITDPHLDAWYDKSGQEIGDKCNNPTFPISFGNDTWQLQDEWSNASTSCVASFP